MTHKLIKTDKYLLVVDDSEIKKAEHIYDLDLQKIVIADDLKVATSKTPKCWFYKKITAHLPLNGAPILEGVPSLPRLEDDVEQFANEYSNEFMNGDYVYDGYNKAGYNKAREKYKWTDEDVIRIVEKTRETGLTAEYLMVSLQQPKYPIAFDCDEIYIGGDIDDSDDYDERDWGVKTFTNSEGRTEWVGKYIYE